jgi:hypothetical protein
MYNSSLGGMYFESEGALQPGSDIRIKMVTHSSEYPGSEALETCRARVKWCQKRNKSGISCYGIGIKYIDKSYTFCSGHSRGIRCSCDFCGQKVPPDKILEIEDLVYLCQSCFNYFKDLPEGRIKESIKEFLIGNVI